MTFFTHCHYFRYYRLSVAEYGEILVAQAFCGKKMGPAQRAYDIVTSKGNFNAALKRVFTDNPSQTSSDATEDIRIQVRSKLDGTAHYKASVVHCKEGDLVDGGMTHLAIVLVHPCSPDHGDSTQGGDILHAWLMTRDTAALLRRRKGKTQYIKAGDLKMNPPLSGVIDIKCLLSEAALRELPLDRP